MSQAIKLSPSLRFLPSRTTGPRDPVLDTAAISGVICQNLSLPSFKQLALPKTWLDYRFHDGIHACGEKVGAFDAWNGEKESLRKVDDAPVSVELMPICSETQFDRILGEAQQLEESVVILWMANWCRKCIYLKPKLEKLAADYYPRLQFYCVDVNNVPHKIVARAGVTKMPTIQIWKDGKKQAEVIGGHKAFFVINEVREMIENEYSA